MTSLAVCRFRNAFLVGTCCVRAFCHQSSTRLLDSARCGSKPNFLHVAALDSPHSEASLVIACAFVAPSVRGPSDSGARRSRLHLPPPTTGLLEVRKTFHP